MLYAIVNTNQNILLDAFFKFVLQAIVSAAPHLPNLVGMGQTDVWDLDLLNQ